MFFARQNPKTYLAHSESNVLPAVKNLDMKLNTMCNQFDLDLAAKIAAKTIKNSAKTIILGFSCIICMRLPITQFCQKFLLQTRFGIKLDNLCDPL